MLFSVSVEYKSKDKEIPRLSSLQAVGLCRKIHGQCPWVTQSLIHIAYHFTLREILLAEKTFRPTVNKS